MGKNEPDSVAFIKTDHGVVARSRAFHRLSPHAQDLVQQLEEMSLLLRDLEDGVAQRVSDLRDHGVSWGILAPAVGMSVEGARTKYSDRPMEP